MPLPESTPKPDAPRVCSVCGKDIPKGVGHFIYMDKVTCVPCHEAKPRKGV
jgi:ribosomal protein L24E